MKAVSINNLAIIYSRGDAYRVNFAFMAINEVSSLVKSSSNLINKRGVLPICVIIKWNTLNK